MRFRQQGVPPCLFDRRMRQGSSRRYPGCGRWGGRTGPKPSLARDEGNAPTAVDGLRQGRQSRVHSAA